MRDKDSDLIFESYKKDVVLNEADPATATLVGAGVGITLFEVLALAAAAIGATALSYQLAKKSDQIQGLFKATPASQYVMEKIASIIQKQDFSIRGLYDSFNFAKSLGAKVPVMEQSISMSKGALEMLKYLESGSLDQNQTLDYIKSILFTLQEQSKILLDIAQKTNSNELIEIVNQTINIINNGVINIQNIQNNINIQNNYDALEKNKPSGNGSNNGKDPKTDWWAKVKDIVKFLLTLKGLIVILITIIAGYILYGRIYGAEAVGGLLMRQAKDAAETAVDVGRGAAKEIEKPANPPAQAAPTPIPGFKRSS